MEILKGLITRLRHIGVLLVIGLILIIYIALGFVYYQQGIQQKEIEEKIAKVSAIVSRPFTGGEKLQAELEEVNRKLAPMTDTDAIDMLVAIAEENGIDVARAGGKFRVPSAAFGQAKPGGGTYRLISFKGITVQGDYDDVMSFLSDLDSGRTLPTMLLTRVSTSEVTIMYAGDEGARRAEFRNVVTAVMDMMQDNNLIEIPNPINYAGDVAINLMGDDPDTEGTVEGFPDITTTAAEKGYSGNVTPRDGYVLYGHDRISTDNTTQFDTVSYISIGTTTYYYTCEANGRVRQFDGANVATATEYFDSEPSRIELIISVDVNIYTKP